MKTVVLIDEPKVKLDIPSDSKIEWTLVRRVLKVSYPTLREYKKLVGSPGHKYIGVNQIERLAKCMAWCDYGRSTNQTNTFNRRSFRSLELRRKIDSELHRYGVNWISIWNKLAQVILVLNQHWVG